VKPKRDNSNRVNMGGSWLDSAQFARVAYRGRLDPSNRSSSLGFRLVHDGDNRVDRGGGWLYGPRSARVAYRGSNDPAYHSDYLGFRLAREGS